MTILSVEGADLYYELHGEGPPLVLIHGASGTHLSWWQQVAELRYRYSCLIYDLRGYGRSRPTGSYDPGDGHAHVRDLERLVEHVGFTGKISLMGASLGTAPALQFAAEHPERSASSACRRAIASSKAASRRNFPRAFRRCAAPASSSGSRSPTIPTARSARRCTSTFPR
jgi:pimeloyl-ACP methyl ester carboxylesterase